MTKEPTDLESLLTDFRNYSRNFDELSPSEKEFMINDIKYQEAPYNTNTGEYVAFEILMSEFESRRRVEYYGGFSDELVVIYLVDTDINEDYKTFYLSIAGSVDDVVAVELPVSSWDEEMGWNYARIYAVEKVTKTYTSYSPKR